MLSVFDAADLDGNGSIDFSEFIKNEWQVSTTEKGVKFTLHLVQYKIYKYYIDLLPKLFSIFHGGKRRMRIAQNIYPQQHHRKIIPP